jgi:asparagine synthetase B (glutamine-hydrolysing)
VTVPAALATGPPAERSVDDWVLPFSLDEPGRAPSKRVQWAEWGQLRGFFHGLLFDRESLAESTDRSQPPRSDIELVLRAYEREGERILSRLRGSFVVAIIDRARDVAIVARDPLGSHPLFYVEVGPSVVFAATPRPLLELPGVSTALNRAALADHLCHRWPDPQETFFTAVRRVLPGWQAIVGGGRLRLSCYWHPTPEDRPIEWLAAEEAFHFDDLFERSIDRCIGNEPTGIFLSGGLDSIAVAAFAADRARRIGRDLPRALSLGFPDPECDERERQAAIARALGLPQDLVGFEQALGSRPLLEQSLELNRKINAPLLNPWSPAYLALAEQGKLNGVRTILTGQGGDEWLSVTPYLSADLIRRGAFIELAKLFGTLLRSHRLGPLALARNSLWRCGLRPLGAMVLHRIAPKARNASRLKRLLAGDPSWIAPDPVLRAEQQQRAKSAMTDPDPPQGFYVRELRTGLDHPLVSWESEEQYELGKLTGVRFLHPFTDPDVVEMLYRTPPNILNEGGRTKGLVRRALGERFPGLGLERQRKVLATSFFQSIVQCEGPALAKIAGNFPALTELGVVDGRAAAAAVRDDVRASGSRLQKAWGEINLEVWTRVH